MTQKQDFARILASLEGGDCEERPCETSLPPLRQAEPKDSLQLSVQAENRLGPAKQKSPNVQPSQADRTRHDGQGNVTLISGPGLELASQHGVRVAWETVLRQK